MKSIAFLPAAVMALTPAAIAGPYANVETNAGWSGNSYDGQTTEVHAGFENALGEDASWYVQGGPAFFAVAGDEGYVEYSGKAGVGVALSDDLTAYGEVSAITNDKSFELSELSWGTKAGLTYKF